MEAEQGDGTERRAVEARLAGPRHHGWRHGRRWEEECWVGEGSVCEYRNEPPPRRSVSRGCLEVRTLKRCQRMLSLQRRLGAMRTTHQSARAVAAAARRWHARRVSEEAQVEARRKHLMEAVAHGGVEEDGAGIGPWLVGAAIA